MGMRRLVLGMILTLAGLAALTLTVPVAPTRAKAEAGELPVEARQRTEMQRLTNAWLRWVETNAGRPEDLADGFITELTADDESLYRSEILRLKIARELLAPQPGQVAKLLEQALALPLAGVGYHHPWNMVTRLIEGLVTFGRFDEAADVAKTFHERWPNDRYPHKTYVALLCLAGRHAEAVPHLVSLLETNTSIFGSHYNYRAATLEDSERTRFFLSIHHPEAVGMTQIAELLQTDDKAPFEMRVQNDLPEVDLWARGAAKSDLTALFAEDLTPSGEPADPQGKGRYYLMLRLEFERAYQANDVERAETVRDELDQLLGPLGARDTEPFILLSLRYYGMPEADEYGSFAAKLSQLTALRRRRISRSLGNSAFTRNRVQAGLNRIIVQTFMNMPAADFADNFPVIAIAVGADADRLALVALRRRMLAGDTEAAALIEEHAHLIKLVSSQTMLGPEAPLSDDIKATEDRLNRLLFCYTRMFPGLHYQGAKSTDYRRQAYQRSLTAQMEAFAHEPEELAAFPPPPWDFLAEIHRLADHFVKISGDSGTGKLATLVNQMNSGIRQVRAVGSAEDVQERYVTNADYFKAYYDLLAARIDHDVWKTEPFPTSPLFPVARPFGEIIADYLRALEEKQDLTGLAASIAKNLDEEESPIGFEVCYLAVARVALNLSSAAEVDAALDAKLKLSEADALPVGPVALWHLEHQLKAAAPSDSPLPDLIMKELLAIEAAAASRESFNGSATASSFYSGLEPTFGWGFPARFRQQLGKESVAWHRILQASERQFPRLEGYAPPTDGEALNANAWSYHLLGDRLEPSMRVSLWSIAVGSPYNPAAGVEATRFSLTSAPMDTYANLLADLGRLDEAITWQSRALRLSEGNESLEVTLLRMKVNATLMAWGAKGVNPFWGRESAVDKQPGELDGAAQPEAPTNDDPKPNDEGASD